MYPLFFFIGMNLHEGASINEKRCFSIWVAFILLLYSRHEFWNLYVACGYLANITSPFAQIFAEREKSATKEAMSLLGEVPFISFHFCFFLIML